MYDIVFGKYGVQDGTQHKDDKRFSGDDGSGFAYCTTYLEGY